MIKIKLCNHADYDRIMYFTYNYDTNTNWHMFI